MRIYFLVFTLLFLASTRLHAEIIDVQNVASHKLLNSSVTYLQNSHADMEIADVINLPETSTWLSFNDTNPTAKKPTSPIWIKVTLQNTLENQANYLIELPYLAFNSVELYHLNNKQRLLANYIMGHELPFSSKPIAHRNYVFPALLPSHSTTDIFIRLSDHKQLNTPIVLWHEKAFWDHADTEIALNMTYFFVIGLMILLTLWNTAFKPNTPTYLYLGVLLTPLVILLTIEGYGIQYLWPDAPEWNNNCLASLIPAAIIFSYLFISIVFNYPYKNRLMPTLLLISTIINVFLLGISLIVDGLTAITLNLASASIFIGLFLKLTFDFWYDLSHKNKIYSLGFLWLTMSYLLYLLGLGDSITLIPITEITLKIGLLIFTFCFLRAQKSAKLMANKDRTHYTIMGINFFP